MRRRRAAAAGAGGGCGCGATDHDAHDPAGALHTPPLDALRLDTLVTALRGVLTEDQILTAKTDRYNRAGCPRRSRCTGGRSGCPTWWSCRPPPSRSPPSCGSPTTCGCRSCRGRRHRADRRRGAAARGIVVDVKRMNQIHELDLVNRTVTVGTGINMLKLNERLARTGSSIRTTRRPTRARWWAGGSGPAAGRSSARATGTPATSCSASTTCCCRPARSCTSATASAARSASPRAATSSSTCSWGPGHAGHRHEATLFPKPEAELSPFWAFDNYDDAYACVGALARAGVATFAGAVLFDEYKVAYLRRDDEAYIPQPNDVRALVCSAMYGYEDEVRPAAGGCSASPRSTARATSATRSPRATGPPGTTGTPPPARPDQGRPGRCRCRGTARTPRSTTRTSPP